MMKKTAVFVEGQTELIFVREFLLKIFDYQNITFCYAIMETEAWFLGIQNWLTQIDSRLTNDFIQANLGFDLANTDPETAFFHPATTLGKIYALADKKYGKSDSDTNSIVHHFEKNHFENLYLSPKCASFRGFYDGVQ